MSINDKPHAPIELDVTELPRQDGEGRVVQLGIKAWASTPCSDAAPGTDRQETSRTYHLSWEQLLELQYEIARQIEFMRPLVEAGNINVKALKDKYMKRAFEKEIIVNETCPTTRLGMIKSNLELGAYYSSFDEPQPPFSLDDESWNPPPSLDWYEGFVKALAANAPSLTEEILGIIQKLDEEEQLAWDEHDSNKHSILSRK